MRHVIFVIPFAMPATLRFVRAAAQLPGVRVATISQMPAGHLPGDIRARIAAHETVTDALDADVLTQAVRAVGRQLGGVVHALIGILEPLQEPLAAVRERLGIPGMSLEVARAFRDKAHMKDLLRQHDLPCARHRLVASVDEAVAFAHDCGLPLVVKPPAGAGAKNTFRVDTEEQLRRCLAELPPSAERRVLLEEFIVGREFSFDSVSVRGRHVFHSISRYYPTPLEVLENPWMQWCVLLPRDISGNEFAAIRQAGPRTLDVLGMVTGMTHMEWFQRGDGSIAISEVAARPPGAQFTSLIGYAHDVDMYAAWARLMAFETFEVPERRYAVGAAFLRGQGRGKVVAVHGVEQARAELGDMVVEAQVPEPGQPQASSYEGEGYVILRHPDTARVEHGLKYLVTHLKVELG